jgi:hypothetical protein
LRKYCALQVSQRAKLEGQGAVMEHNAERLRLPALVLGSIALLGLVAAGFYGWLQHGSAILLAAGETALSWCF